MDCFSSALVDYHFIERQKEQSDDDTELCLIAIMSEASLFKFLLLCFGLWISRLRL
jgi:hypothetical protein